MTAPEDSTAAAKSTTPEESATEPHSSSKSDSPSVAPSGTASSTKSSGAWVALVLVGFVSLAVLSYVWMVMDPEYNTLGYELARTLLQVFGIAVLGGVITVATSIWQDRRKRDDSEQESERKKAATKLEHRRQDIEIRATLLDRSSRCAQSMYVTCQHVARVQQDLQARPETAADDAHKMAMAELDVAYLAFSSEALAIQTVIGARFGIHTVDDEAGRRHPYLYWHQIYDLLTVYYFNLCGNFRDDVLETNSIKGTERHSGLDLKATVTGFLDPRNPTPHQLAEMREAIRPAFTGALPILAELLLASPIQDGRSEGDDPALGSVRTHPRRPARSARY